MGMSRFCGDCRYCDEVVTDFCWDEENCDIWPHYTRYCRHPIFTGSEHVIYDEEEAEGCRFYRAYERYI